MTGGREGAERRVIHKTEWSSGGNENQDRKLRLLFVSAVWCFML